MDERRAVRRSVSYRAFLVHWLLPLALTRRRLRAPVPICTRVEPCYIKDQGRSPTMFLTTIDVKCQVYANYGFAVEK